MSEPIVVIGFGAVGRAVTQALLARGREVIVAQRNRPLDLPAGATYRVCDVLDAAPDSIRVRTVDGEERKFRVDADTFIRIEHPGVRQSIEDYVANTATGRRIVLIFDGDHAETLRRAAEG